MEVGLPGRRFVVGLVPDEITIVKVSERNTALVDSVYFFDITGVEKARPFDQPRPTASRRTACATCRP